MPSLERTLAEPQAAGLYRLPARAPLARVARAAASTGRDLYTLDGVSSAAKAAFLRACATALAFPAYFGRNWDALQDCLTDLAWTPPRGRVILIAHAAAWLAQAPADRQTALDILAFAVAYWRPTPTPLWVLLHGAGRGFPAIPLLGAGPEAD